jgi:Arc/MetJ family transcription regulator
MKVNIQIDDDLIQNAISMSGLNSIDEAVEEGLKLLVQVSIKKSIRLFRGKLKWEGDLERMRLDS